MYGIYWVVLKVLKKIKDHEVTFLKRNFLKTSIYTTDAYLAPYCLPTNVYLTIKFGSNCGKTLRPNRHINICAWLRFLTGPEE